MTEVENEIEKVQVHIDMVNDAIALADKLDVLNRIPEFEEIIIDGFMKSEPARYAQIITDPEMQDDVNQREVLGAIKAVGYLADYLRNIEKRGEQMKMALDKAEAYKSELLNPDTGEE